MKKQLFSLFAILLIAGFSTKMMAQTVPSSTASSTATATIIAPLAIAYGNQELSFGNLISAVGSVTISPSGARLDVGLVTPGTQLGTLTAAKFNVTGQGTYTYAITVPTNASNYTITNGADSMILSDFTPGVLAGTLGTLSGGLQTFYVGAKLNVTAGLSGGVYTNTTGFDVTVNYN